MSTDNSKKRPSEAELLKRRQIGLQIINEHRNEISVKAFQKEYSQRIQKELSTSISRNSISRDIDWIIGEIRKENPTFEFTTKALRKSSSKDTITPLAFFEKDITEIHLVFSDHTNVIIFDTEHMQLGAESFVENAKNHIPQSLPDNSLLVLRIFFNSMAYRGIETVVCDMYERTPDFSSFNIVSTSARHRCAEIEIKKSSVVPLLEFTYKLFNRYWKTRVAKAQKAKERTTKKTKTVKAKTD